MQTNLTKMAMITLAMLGFDFDEDDMVKFGEPYCVRRASVYDECAKCSTNDGMFVVISDVLSTDVASDFTDIIIYDRKNDLMSFIDHHIRRAGENDTVVLTNNHDGSVNLVVFDADRRTVSCHLIYGLDQDTLSMYHTRERMIPTAPFAGIPYGKTLTHRQLQNTLGYYTEWDRSVSPTATDTHPIAIVDDGDDSSMQYVFFEDLTALVAHCRHCGVRIMPDGTVDQPHTIIGASRDEIIAAFA